MCALARHRHLKPRSSSICSLFCIVFWFGLSRYLAICLLLLKRALYSQSNTATCSEFKGLLYFGSATVIRQSLSSLYLYIKREERKEGKTDKKSNYRLGVGN